LIGVFTFHIISFLPPLPTCNNQDSKKWNKMANAIKSEDSNKYKFQKRSIWFSEHIKFICYWIAANTEMIEIIPITLLWLKQFQSFIFEDLSVI
jgi:hypothetical protein